ncbi:hypothetical protein BDW75DRAFT_197114 [Aspergillus navahoensis]
MPRYSKQALPRYTPSARFPITSALHKALPIKGNRTHKPNIVSEGLCDDILKRLSPFLSRNAPIDVLDLWPGAGVLSSKINDYLKPRKHVLIEPEMEIFKRFIEPWAKGRPNCSIVETKLTGLRDWKGLLSEHFPEQTPANTHKSGLLARNDTLLVLANPPGPRSTKDHFRASRWVQVFMEECLRQSGLHAYGSVRLLVSLTAADVNAILPRNIGSRVRQSLLAEQAALHAFEVASTVEDQRGYHAYSRQWDVLTAIEKRVEQRTFEKNIVVPMGRAFPPIEAAPESPIAAPKPVPYTFRAMTPQHEKYLTDMEKLKKVSPKAAEYEEAQNQYRKIAAAINHDNHQIYCRIKVCRIQSEIDDLNKEVSRVAARPDTTLGVINRLVKRIEAAEAALHKETSILHSEISRSLPYLKDDRRAVYHNDNLDDSLLLLDRRPFDPLLIESEEMYPQNIYRTWMYFEADPNPIPLRYMQQLNEEQKYKASNFFTAFAVSLQVSNTVTVPNLMKRVFHTYSTNDLVRAAPTLAIHAFKRPKPDFDSLPKTVHYDPLCQSSAKQDPASGYQENLDYDLSEVRIRLLSVETVWSLAVEFAKNGMDIPLVDLTRILGGTTTAAQTRDFGDRMRKRW